MPRTVSKCFERFLRDITLSGDHRRTARDRADNIVERLGSEFEIVEAWPTGSLMRGTALRFVSDVDVFVVMASDARRMTPRTLLQRVRDTIGEAGAGIAKKNGQAVTVYFDSWPMVDVVPAVAIYERGAVDHYEIPDLNRGVWIKTNPRWHDDEMEGLPAEGKALVRMLKTWNRAHSEMFESFHLEILVLETKARDATDPGWALYDFFSKAADLVRQPLRHMSADYDEVDAYLTNPADRAEAKKRIEAGRDTTSRAWDEEHAGRPQEAIRLYRVLFGEDEFPDFGP